MVYDLEEVSGMVESTKSKLEAIPSGWCLSGSHPADYIAGIDKTQAHSGSQCASLVNRVAAPDVAGFATLMQEVSAKNYAGKRIKMSAWLKTEEIQSWASLWLSVYGPAGRTNVSFDNMCDRTITGTTSWTKHDIVLDVPFDGTKLGFGAILAGVGQLWVDDFTFEEVGSDIAITDCPCSERRKKSAEEHAPLVPTNLSFEEN